MNLPRFGKRSEEVGRLRELLRSREARERSGSIVLEGKTLIADAISRGVVVERVYIAEDAVRAFRQELDTYRAREIEIAELALGAIDRISSTRTPQPLLAEVASPFREHAELRRDGLLLGLVGVSDPGNLGTIIRAGEAAGVAGIVHVDGCDVTAPKVVRASAGSCFGVPIRSSAQFDRAELAADGRTILGAVGRQGIALPEVEWSRPHAVVLGSESHGIPGDVIEQLDGLVHIPMSGLVESLNVAMAASVIAFVAGMSRRG